MSDNQSTYRLSKVAKEFNLSLSTIVDFLSTKNYKIKADPNGKIGEAEYKLLLKEYQGDKSAKEEAAQVAQSIREKKETVILEDLKSPSKKPKEEKDEIMIKDMSATDKVLESLVKKERERIAAEELKAQEKAKAEEEAKKLAQQAEKKEEVKAETKTIEGPKVLGKVDLSTLNQKTKPDKKSKKELAEEKEKAEKEKKKTSSKKTEEKPTPAPEPILVAPETPKAEETPVAPTPVKEAPKEDFLETKFQKLEGPKILGNIVLPVEKKPSTPSQNDANAADKKKRKRIKKGSVSEQEIKNLGQKQAQVARDKFKGPDRRNNNQPKREAKPALTDEEIQAQIKETLARLSQSGSKSKASKYRREKREENREKLQEAADNLEAEKKVLKVTEFISASQLSQMMNVPVTQVISTCMQLGLFVSINQRLDAETIAIVVEEFGFKVEFVTVEAQESIKEEVDKPEDLKPRPPVVTVMGHVDHGKTSLLDFIRKANVIAGEAGGITQHIGAYNVKLDNGKNITFLDTPGHEAFTAMRARGAKVTDVAIIVVAADDNVMPQTKEAITHAQAAGVPMVFAINKIDKPGANPDKIRETLAAMNILVEEWGGKFQCQEISAKQGKNIDLLLEKVLLEAEMLELKANPKRRASGTVIETKLDKGRGYEATVLVETGTLKVGDVVLAGSFHGRVKALNNERGTRIQSAGPAIPVMLLGLNGAPQAGDKFHVLEDEREARELATKRLQLQREQGMRARKHITLDEIGRRLAIGDFKELNVLVKGDVDGSVEALSDSLLKLSTEKVQVNIILKSVGAISESDVMLASASNAIILGFQVRPTANARKLAETEEIDIRLYSIIYDAINEVKAAMEGMLAPEFEEKITCNIEIREVFKISKVGTIAGCYVLDGKVNRNTKVRIIRDGIVIHSGALGSLKRFKDDVKEVASGYECGLNIDKFNDIQVGDIIEGYEMVEIKAKL
jgi:translation initiation factor IF-2